MKKNLYYRTMFQRKNMIKELVLNLFLSISSYPKMILEVFLRKNFGERYFSFATAVTISVILAIIPFGAQGMKALMRGRMILDWSSLITDWATWYLFIAAFIHVCIQRRREVKHNPSVFDFKRFSLYSGNINDWFFRHPLFGKVDQRTIEVLTEPLVCALAGLILVTFGQAVGVLIITCAIIYSLSYAGAYHQGDHFVMDKIDEMICNEEMFDAFVGDKDASETRGVRFYGRKPANGDIRRKVVTSFIDEAEPTLVAS